MNGEIQRLVHKEWGHPNFTIDKVARFTIGYLIAFPIGLFLLWVFTDKVGLWYIYSSFISAAVVGILRFVASAVFTFRKERE